MTTALILGLRYSAIVLWFAVLFRVSLHWRSGAPINQKKADLEKVGLWWRWTWGVVAVTVIAFSGTQIFEIKTGRVDDWFWVVALVGINLGGAMAKAGFLMNRGARAWAVAPLLVIPAVFVSMSLWGWR